ncbi:MAG TPA: response regulator [Xanthomonadales bacterium]|nr:response regulator [Xanthomonadales bacterium]
MRRGGRICIIDDDEAIREALRLLLSAAGISSHLYASADEFLARTDNRLFDCVLLDIRMPGMDGLGLFQHLLRERAQYPVIFITGHGDIPLAVGAIKQGAFDFLTKPFREGELLEKVNAAIQHFRDQKDQRELRQELSCRMESCTPRERDVMRLMVAGLHNKDIGEELQISPRTVEIHRAQVMAKMQAESLPALVRMTASLGIFPDGGGDQGT